MGARVAAMVDRPAGVPSVSSQSTLTHDPVLPQTVATPFEDTGAPKPIRPSISPSALQPKAPVTVDPQLSFDPLAERSAHGLRPSLTSSIGRGSPSNVNPSDFDP